MTLRYLANAAELSADGLYRYSLTRVWDAAKGKVVFIGLNPSTADASVDDPTIRRCVGFAQALGAGRLVMLNLFAWRATDPADLPGYRRAVGPDNDEALRRESAGALYVIAAWGAFPLAAERAAEVRTLLSARGPMHCLRRTKSGAPSHPLYLPANLRPIPYEAPHV